MAPDGVIEGIESAGSDQVAAVQWHPENMWREHPEMRALFEQFIARVEKSVQNKRNTKIERENRLTHPVP